MKHTDMYVSLDVHCEKLYSYVPYIFHKLYIKISGLNSFLLTGPYRGVLGAASGAV